MENYTAKINIGCSTITRWEDCNYERLKRESLQYAQQATPRGNTAKIAIYREGQEAPIYNTTKIIR